MGARDLGQLFLILGLALSVAGLVLIFHDRLPFFGRLGRLPGDIQFGGDHWKVFFPLGTSLLLSVVLSLILWLFSRWTGR